MKNPKMSVKKLQSDLQFVLCDQKAALSLDRNGVSGICLQEFAHHKIS